jgi:aspartate/methionine/tyrosine aminotransferase
VRGGSSWTDAHGYQPTIGTPELRNAMAGFYQTLVWRAPRSQFFREYNSLIGSKEGILHVTLAFVNPGDTGAGAQSWISHLHIAQQDMLGAR